MNHLKTELFLNNILSSFEIQLQGFCNRNKLNYKSSGLKVIIDESGHIDYELQVKIDKTTEEQSYQVLDILREYKEYIRDRNDDIRAFFATKI